MGHYEYCAYETEATEDLAELLDSLEEEVVHSVASLEL